MIVDNRKNLARYKGINKNLDIALDWLMTEEPEKLTEGIQLNGKYVYANKQFPEMAADDERIWESHFKYLDIHVAIDGNEKLCYKNNTENMNWHGEGAGDDIEFSNDSADSNYVKLMPGYCAILWPGEPHRPNIGTGPYTKIIVKVLI